MCFCSFSQFKNAVFNLDRISKEVEIGRKPKSDLYDVQLSFAQEEKRILETEQLYGQLFDVILRSNNRDLLHQYTRVLNDEYPEKLLQLYREIVEKQAESTGSRKHYYQIVEELRIMKSITGGDKIVDEIIKKWKVQYKNRSAMLDELNGI